MTDAALPNSAAHCGWPVTDARLGAEWPVLALELFIKGDERLWFHQ